MTMIKSRSIRTIIRAAFFALAFASTNGLQDSFPVFHQVIGTPLRFKPRRPTCRKPTTA